MSVTKPVVAIVRIEEQDTFAAVCRAVDLLGGIGQIVPRGSRVLLKPNLVVAPCDWGVTSSAVIDAVMRLVKTAGPSEIIIGEGSADCYTSQVFRLLGIYDIARRYGAQVVDLNVQKGVRRPVPAGPPRRTGLGRDYVVIPQVVAECDVLVSLPTLKLHGGGGALSLNLKNLFGLLPAAYYGYNKNSAETARDHPEWALPGEVGSEQGVHKPTTEQTIAAINLAVKTDLAIIDATEGFVGSGKSIRMDLLIAGTNALATDSVGHAVGGVQPDGQAAFQFYRDMGLGPCCLDAIEVRGERIEEVAFDLRRVREENILEVRLADGLRRLSLGELQEIARAMRILGLASQEGPGDNSPAALRAFLERQMTKDGYWEKALSLLPDQSLLLLRVILARGGTSGDYYGVGREFQAVGGRWLEPSLRALLRLGLVFLWQGASKCYFVVPEGLPAIAQGFIAGKVG